MKKLVWVCLSALLVACGADEQQTGDTKFGADVGNDVNTSQPELTASSDVGWPLHGLDNKEHRYSTLDDVNVDNVNQLQLAWYVDLPEARGQEATPLVVDGVMYTSAAWSHVYAIDPKTGETLWHFDPKVDKANRVKGCCGPVNRGVAHADGQIFIGAFDGRLIALDAKTGEQAWSTQTVDTTKNYTITGCLLYTSPSPRDRG